MHLMDQKTMLVWLKKIDDNETDMSEQLVENCIDLESDTSG